MKLNILGFLILIFQSTFAYAERPYEIIVQELLDDKTTIDKHVALVLESDKVGRPLTGFELNEINKATAQRLNLRAEAYQFFEGSKPLLQNKTWRKKLFTNQELSRLIKSIAVSVTLFDLSIYTNATFNQSKRLRRIMNEEDAAYEREENSFHNATKNAFTLRNRTHLNRAFTLYQEYSLSTPAQALSPDLKLARMLIESSFYYNEMLGKKRWEYFSELKPVVKSKLSLSLNNRIDAFEAIGGKIIFGLSKVFGNAAGGFQNRQGKLYQNNDFLINVQTELKPLDILLEKTPFRLTDKFIPGYWGHAAIFIGTVEDLKQLGLWNHKLVRKYKKHILNGRLIVEALRSDVEINTLESFSDIDDFAILRSRTEYTKDEKKEHILRALSHIGKHYDFNFDVETGKTIVCSELHYRVFIKLPFTTTKILNRNTISVDQVAAMGLADNKLEPIMLYLDGKKIDEGTVQEEFDKKIPLEKLKFILSENSLP